MLYLFFVLVHYVKFVGFMWVVGAVLLTFGTWLDFTKPIFEPLLKGYMAGTKKVVGGIVDAIGKFVEWAFKLIVNITWWVARICGALLANLLILCANLIRALIAQRRRRPAPAPWPYRPMPVWANLFPKRRNPAHGHGGGGGHH